MGSTINFKNRKVHHLNDLRRGNHHCTYLQRVWSKCNESDFSFQCVEKVSEEVDLIKVEQSHLDESFKTGLCMNICKVAGTCRGVVQSDETKRKRAKKLIGLKRTEEQKARMSAARKAVGITKEHQALLNRISAERAFSLSKDDAKRIYQKRFVQLIPLQEIAKEMGLTVKPLRRELKKVYGPVKWPSIKNLNRKRGQSHGMAKLNEDSVRRILESKLKLKDTAKQFGVSFACVCDIKYGRSWKHISL